MKVSIKQLRRLIKEELAAQAPLDAPLGQYAWPAERHLPVDEPDTEIETELLAHLVDAVSERNVPLPKEDVMLLHDFFDEWLLQERFLSTQC